MSEKSQNQLQDDSEVADMIELQCPLEPTTFLKSLRSTGLRILEEIERHISTSNLCHHPPLNEVVLHGSLDGTTPLLLACHFGDLNWVKHIVENWRVDIQAAGVYYTKCLPDRWSFDRATPLFVAAFNLHIDIVKYLVGLGADVSSKTSAEITGFFDGLTPLLGALQQPRRLPESLAIARFLLESGADPSALPSTGYPIWTTYGSCGLDVITALVQHGLNLDQLDHCGETILHYWAGTHFCRPLEESLPVVKFLVNSGARLMARDTKGFTPILTAAFSSNLTVLDYMLEKVEIDWKEKIDSLEMAAAEILSYSNGRNIWRSSNGLNMEPERAFEYLRKALDLRQIGPFHMTPLILKRGRKIRWTTAAELDQVIEQTAEHLPLCYLIQLRICSGRSWKAVDSFSGFLSNCVSILKEQNRFIDLLNVLWATLETIQFHQTDSDSECDLWRMTDDVVENLIWVISQLGKDDPLNIAGTFKAILKVIIAADLEHSRSDSPRSDRHIDTLLELVTFLAGLSEEMLNEESQEEPTSIMKFLGELVYLDRGGDNCGETLLHMACYDYIDLATIHLLLEAGANPNTRDDYGDGPLHILAIEHNSENGIMIESAARLLLKYRAHLHMVNKKRETPADVWMKRNKKKDEVLPELGALAEIEVVPEMEAEALPDNEALPVPEAAVLPEGEISLPEWLREPETIPLLTCLCARVIRPFLFAFKKGEDFPATLGDFIEWH